MYEDTHQRRADASPYKDSVNAILKELHRRGVIPRQSVEDDEVQVVAEPSPVDAPPALRPRKPTAGVPGSLTLDEIESEDGSEFDSGEIWDMNFTKGIDFTEFGDDTLEVEFGAGKAQQQPLVIVINPKAEIDSTVVPLMSTPYDEPAPALEEMPSNEKEAVISTGLFLLVLMMMVSMFTSHIFRKLRIRPLQLSVVATMLGLIVGAILKFAMAERTILERILAFNEDVFFILLLPPIIFESGWSLSGTRGHHFFKNFGAIIWFAFFATSLSFCFIGSTMYFAGLLGLSMEMSPREYFAFGALISSTDPVSVLTLFRDLNAQPTITAIVSGEALLNDAISIVLYRAIANPNSQSVGMAFLQFFATFGCSLSIGVGVGLLCALVYKHMEFPVEENQTLEVSVLVLFPWISYLISDGFSQSGIVSILFCGITMGKYTHPNLSASAQDTAESLFGTLSLLAETVVFVFLGLAVFSFPQKSATAGLFGCSLIFVSLGRVISVYVTSAFVNAFRSRNPVTPNIQHTLVLCGLRGAIAFALALRARHDFGGTNGASLLSAALFYALFTIIVIGMLLPWAFDRLDVFQTESARQPYTDASADEYRMNSSYAGVRRVDTDDEEMPRAEGRAMVAQEMRLREDVTAGTGRWIKRMILRFDDKMKLVFTNRHQVKAMTTTIEIGEQTEGRRSGSSEAETIGRRASFSEAPAPSPTGSMSSPRGVGDLRVGEIELQDVDGISPVVNDRGGNVGGKWSGGDFV